MTREEAVTFLTNLIDNIQEEGPEDQYAWEQRAALYDAVQRISTGEDVQTVMEDL